MPPSRKAGEHETINQAKRWEQEIALTLEVRKAYYDEQRPLDFVVSRYSRYRDPQWIVNVVFYRHMGWVIEEDSESKWEIL